MDITFLGQAGLFIETKHGSILCDPWFNTAYFASWFPFPSNEDVDIEKLSRPTYLYISHLHHDHFDPQFLREHVWKEATVLLPDYPLDLLERALRDIGFTKFMEPPLWIPLAFRQGRKQWFPQEHASLQLPLPLRGNVRNAV